MSTANAGRRTLLGLTLCAVLLTAPVAAHAQTGKASPGEMRWALHVTLAARWLDPAETEVFSTPFMVMYALHDAVVKPMPGGRRADPRLLPLGSVRGPAAQVIGGATA